MWKCGNIGIGEGKSFKCITCGHVYHADANASFNIALRPPLVESIGQLHVDRDACKGSTDTPRGATLRTTETPEPPSFSEESMSAVPFTNNNFSICEEIYMLKSSLWVYFAEE